MPVPFKPPLKKIHISLYWECGFSEGSKYFDTVQDFAEFLKDNPELAKAVGYVPKQVKGKK